MKKLRAYAAQKPGLTLLIVLLIIISIQTIKPGFDFVGWDNYSSYLNPSANLYKTFFSTWREYRGLGVPSDSEVTDLARVLFFYVAQFIFPNTILDQVYWIFSLCLGVIAMYFVTEKVLTLLKYNLSSKKLDVLASIAAFFYLFNLNTLAVFYFPIFPYVPRFFALPLLTLVFINILTKNKVTRWDLIAAIFVFFIVTPAYIIGTVFITIVVTLGVIGLFYGKISKLIKIFILFILANAFWLLPFANYTVQKSDIIRLAPTFISANEVQLNFSPDYYKLYKQIELLPNFFDTTVKSYDGTETKKLHILADDYYNPAVQIILAIFPILYFIGIAVIIKKRKSHKQVFWIPILIGTFLILSLKEYSVFGPIFNFINSYVPLLGVIIRFGDTKLHPIIAFCGSISASIGLYALYNYAINNKKILVKRIKLIGILVIALHIFVYRQYFTGNLVGFYNYNKIPQAYRNITETINTDLDNKRVIHLPYNSTVYWRSYSWGYVGSHFFGYLINKPLMEKTFEPASMENAYVNEKVNILLRNSQNIQGEENLNKKATELYSILKNAGVKHVIFDETVATALPTRGTVFWGRFNVPDARALILQMQKLSLVKQVQVETVKISDLLNEYPNEFPLDEETIANLKKDEAKKIILYEVRDPVDRIEFATDAEFVDSEFKEIAESNVETGNNTIIQANNEIEKHYPFKRLDYKLTNEKDKVTIETGPININEVSFENDAFEGSSLLRITGKTTATNTVISIYEEKLPNLNTNNKLEQIKEIVVPLPNKGASISSNVMSDWHVLPNKEFSDLRLRVENTVIPIPYNLTSAEKVIADVVVHSNTGKLEVFKKDITTKVNLEDFNLTFDPNCHKDKLEGYESSLKLSNETLNISGKNGSVCAWKSLKGIYSQDDYMEVSLDIEGQNKDLDEYKLGKTTKPKLKQVLSELDKPFNVEFCIKEDTETTCFNKHNLLAVKEKATRVFPTDTYTYGTINPVLLISLRNIGYQEMDLKIHNASITRYDSILTDTYTLEAQSEAYSYKPTTEFEINSISFNKPMSVYSYYHKPGVTSFSAPNNPCAEGKAFATKKIIGDAQFAYLENCQNQMFKLLPFNSNNFVLWSTNANVASGQYPFFLLKDSFHDYTERLMFLYQKYPDIEEFKHFQNPEYITTKNAISKKLENLEYKTAYEYIGPNNELRDSRNKVYSLSQWSANEGLFGVTNFDVIDLPTSWQSLYIKEGNTKTNYPTPSAYKATKIIPSLWKVEISKNSLDSEYLLVFNEGFDKQWNVYATTTSVIYGKQMEAKQGRCNGLVNCWVIPTNKIPENGEIYLFYWPERLYFVGWFITISVVFGALIVGRKKFAN